MSVNPSPFGPKPQFLLASGVPAVGNKLFFYIAGSSTKATTLAESSGSIANTNPIILNALGEPPDEIWFTAGQSYKAVYAPSTDTDPPMSPIWTIDHIVGINDTSITPDEWVASLFTPTYLSATSFSVPGDQTSTMQVGRRIRAPVSGGTRYGYINTSAFAAGVTTVTLVLDSGSLDAGLSAISYGILSATNSSEPEWIQSFTPTLQGSTTPGVQTYSSQFGHGRKIGHLFFFTIRLTLSAKDAATAGNLRIAGFPYTGSSNANAMSPAAVGYWKFDIDAGFTQLVGQWEPADGRLYLAECGDNVDKQYLTATNLLADSVIHVSGFYETA